MGTLKVVKAIDEHFYIKTYGKVQLTINKCHICQLVKCNNKKKEGVMIPITSKIKLEKVFLDVCGPFTRSGGRHKYQFIIIMVDHFTRYVNLYPITRATTKNILRIIVQSYLPFVGKPQSIITDYGTQFRGKRWRDELLNLGIKTFKISVYHPNSNPAERVLREVGRILRTHCRNDQRKWSNYLTVTEEFINCSYHHYLNETPYTVMYERTPSREITDLINFPISERRPFEVLRFYNPIQEKTKRQQRKYAEANKRSIDYKIGDKVLIRNRGLPSTFQGIMKKLLLLYIGPYIITKVNGNNTYEITDPITNKIKGTYNQASMKIYHKG